MTLSWNHPEIGQLTGLAVWGQCSQGPLPKRPRWCPIQSRQANPVGTCRPDLHLPPLTAPPELSTSQGQSPSSLLPHLLFPPGSPSPLLLSLPPLYPPPTGRPAAWKRRPQLCRATHDFPAQCLPAYCHQSRSPASGLKGRGQQEASPAFARGKVVGMGDLRQDGGPELSQGGGRRPPWGEWGRTRPRSSLSPAGASHGQPAGGHRGRSGPSDDLHPLTRSAADPASPSPGNGASCALLSRGPALCWTPDDISLHATRTARWPRGGPGSLHCPAILGSPHCPAVLVTPPGAARPPELAARPCPMWKPAKTSEEHRLFTGSCLHVGASHRHLRLAATKASKGMGELYAGTKGTVAFAGKRWED